MDAIAKARLWLNDTSDYEAGLQILKDLKADEFTLMLLSSGNDSFNKSKLFSCITEFVENQSNITIIDELEINPEVLGFKISEHKKEILSKTLNDQAFKADEMSLMDERAEMKAKLRFLANDQTKEAERKEIAFAILDITNKLNKIEEDKEFFNQFGYMPTGLVEPGDDQLKLKTRQSTLRTYLSRYKDHPVKLKEYTEELAIIDAKLKKYAIQ